MAVQVATAITKMKVTRFLLVIPALGVLSLPLAAEDPRSYSYRTPSKQQTTAEVEDLGEIAASPAGEKAAAANGGKEVAPPAPEKSKFRFNVNTRGEFTTNAQLSGNNSSNDFIFLPTIEAGYNTPLGKYFTFDLAGRVEGAFFADNSDRGFAGYSATATVDYRPKPGVPRLYISAEPYRYDGFDEGDLITQAIGLVTGTDWGVPFNNGRSLAFVGFSYGYYFSDPSIDSLQSYRVVAGIAHQFRSNLTGQVYYSWQYNDFTDYSRHDNRNFVGANMIYQFSDRVFGSVTATFVDSDSSVDTASYQSVTGSVGVTVSF
jgi:hypothetical protein